ALRIPGPRRRGPLLRQHLPRRSEVRPHPDTSQRSTGVRSLLARPNRHPPRNRPLRPHPYRRPDQRHDPLRQQRAPVVRASAIAPKPLAGADVTTLTWLTYVERLRRCEVELCFRLDFRCPVHYSRLIGKPRRAAWSEALAVWVVCPRELYRGL